MKYLLDTNICIYVLKNRYVEISRKLEKVGMENAFVSTITVAELEYGIARSKRPKETEEKLYGFLVPFTILDFDTESARQYGRIRNELNQRGTPIGNMDLLIAAIALAKNCRLVTNNVKEFERVERLQVENWIR